MRFVKVKNYHTNFNAKKPFDLLVHAIQKSFYGKKQITYSKANTMGGGGG